MNYLFNLVNSSLVEQFSLGVSARKQKTYFQTWLECLNEDKDKGNCELVDQITVRYKTWMKAVISAKRALLWSRRHMTHCYIPKPALHWIYLAMTGYILLYSIVCFRFPLAYWFLKSSSKVWCLASLLMQNGQ